MWAFKLALERRQHWGLSPMWKEVDNNKVQKKLTKKQKQRIKRGKTMKLSNNRTIADSWLPTFENVSREFIIDNLENLLYSDEIPNLKFDFREKEAIEFIENTMIQYAKSFRDNEYEEKIKARLKKYQKN